MRRLGAVRLSLPERALEAMRSEKTAGAGSSSALAPGVLLVVTRHPGPYKLALRGVLTLFEATARSVERDRRHRSSYHSSSYSHTST
jgi:hypothetical protein